MHPLAWLAQRDLGLAALRRGGRSAIVMPALFALGDKVLTNADIATFAAFGAFAMLLLVDFGGPMRERLQAQVGLAIVGGVFICIGTLTSRSAWLAAVTMAVVGFGALFAGVVSSVLAGATTALLLSLILPITVKAPNSAIPDRLAGWGLASAASLLAISVLWPAPVRHPLRGPAAAACRALAVQLRNDVAYLLKEPGGPTKAEHEAVFEGAEEALNGLQKTFLATPYRPTGLSTSARTVVRLVDELNWLRIVLASVHNVEGVTVNQASCVVKRCAAEVLDEAAAVLENSSPSTSRAHELRASLAGLDRALTAMEHNATMELPVRRVTAGTATADGGAVDLEGGVTEVITSLDPSFRAQELSFAVTLIGGNVELLDGAERRTWWQRWLGRQPKGLSGTASVVQERAAAHVDPHSVWLHNSIRGAVGLGLAVLIANLSGVQHAFWVVLGMLSVLRSNALNTGQNVLRGLLGTVAGFVIGAGIIELVGTSQTVLWFLLPVAILLAGVAPAAISFAAGQAAFTLTLVILYNIIAPAGWRVGLLRVEDIAIGCAVSLVVGVLFWPRGAAAALRLALSEAYTDTSTYLANAVAFGMLRCDATSPEAPAPTDDAIRAAAAGRRLDDAFRGYLAERGAKPLPLAEVTRLVTAVAGLRLGGDAVLDLWQREQGSSVGDRSAARQELISTSALIRTWYEDLALSLSSGRQLREPLPHDPVADGRLIDAVRHDLADEDGHASSTAVRMIWTADHLDAARRLQSAVAGPARNAVKMASEDPRGWATWFDRHLPRKLAGVEQL
ncbi:MAG TPA: FUSC family protein [Frankiaceae bacterium]|nr:FUSC family protein [Frankiaceae bacterium]